MKLVIKIGGSIAIDDEGPKLDYFHSLLPVLQQLQQKHQIIVAIGGGKFLRKYYHAIEKFKLSHENMEWIAIELLRVNVRFLSLLLETKPIYSLDDLTTTTSGVIGGIAPGRSTDANAAVAAATIRADYLIKLTNVDGIYDQDPRRHTHAVKHDHLSFDDLDRFVVSGTPGSYGILDELSIRTIQEHHIKTVVMNGLYPEKMLDVLSGKHVGTLIC